MNESLLAVLGAVIVAAVGGGGWLATRRGSAVAAASDVVELVSEQLKKMTEHVATVEAHNEGLLGENKKLSEMLAKTNEQVSYLRAAIIQLVGNEEGAEAIFDKMPRGSRYPVQSPMSRPTYHPENPITNGKTTRITPSVVMAGSAVVMALTVLVSAIVVVASL